VIRRGFILLVWLLLAGIIPGEALAHASLVGSDPKDGAVLAAIPMRLALTFDEPVTLTSLRLTGPDGKALTLGEAHVEGDTIFVPTPDGLATGSYALSYRVVSADGHPVGGSLIFSLGHVTGSSAAEPSSSPALMLAIWAMRVLFYVGLAFGAGGAAALALLSQPGLDAHLRRFIRMSSVIGVFGAAGGLALQGLDLLGAGPLDLLTGLPWKAALASTYGQTVIVAIAALLMVLAIGPRTAQPRAVAVIAWIAVSLAPVLSGHASTAPEAFAKPAVFLHVAAMSLWIGALAPLTVLMHLPEAGKGLARFSRVIPLPVALLLGSGIALAVIQVGTPDALLGTPYGRILLAKLVLVAALLALALVNRLRLTKPALTGAPDARHRLRRVILAETFLAVLVLGTVSLWRFTPPPRVLAAAAAAEPFYAHVHIGSAMADFVVDPARPGPISVTIMLRKPDMTPLAAKSMTVSFAAPDKGIEAFEREAKPGPDGAWTLDGVVIPAAGVWTVTAYVAVTDFDELTFPAEIVIAPKR
jgi:copper transport protein